MKKVNKNNDKSRNLNIICWFVLPFIIFAALLFDGLNVYKLTTERLIVLGGLILVMLIPFFNEITIKNFSLKKENRK